MFEQAVYSSLLLLLMSPFCKGSNLSGGGLSSGVAVGFRFADDNKLTGQYTMIAPSQPIIAAVGSTVVLPCQLDPTKDLGNLVLEWGRPDLQYVLLTRNSMEHLMNQNPLYLGRTALSDKKLKYGDMSLELSRVKLSDEGTYRCYVPQMDKGAEVTLLVVSVSSPSVHLTTDHRGAAVVLQCDSGAWYPEPELLWLDSEGRLLSAERTHTHTRPDGLYNVSSRVTVEQSSTSTCRVSQSSTNTTRDTHIIITDEFLEVPSCSVSWTLFSLGLCLIIAAAAAFVLWKFKFSRTKAVTKDTELCKTGESERMIQPEGKESLMKTEVKEQRLDLKESGHSEDLERIQEDLQFVEDMINKLTETKELIMSLRETQQLALHQLKSQIEQERRRSISWIPVYKDKQKEEQTQCIKELERTKKECEKVIENADKQMKMTEEIISEATKQKGKLERDKEQVTGEETSGGSGST